MEHFEYIWCDANLKICRSRKGLGHLFLSPTLIKKNPKKIPAPQPIFRGHVLGWKAIRHHMAGGAPSGGCVWRRHRTQRRSSRAPPRLPPVCRGRWGSRVWRAAPGSKSPTWWPLPGSSGLWGAECAAQSPRECGFLRESGHDAILRKYPKYGVKEKYCGVSGSINDSSGIDCADFVSNLARIKNKAFIK